ncbi:MAG TPA: hypothetical protein VFJ62_03715, partial [Usitatibacter sp.]|nr:hypothetical protein [Usitatibacter sp.]
MPDHPRKPSKDESQQLLRFLGGRPGDAAERQKAVNAMRWAAEVDDPDVASRLMEWAREGGAIAARGPAPPEMRSALFRLLRRAIGHPGFVLMASDLPRLEAALARQDSETIRSHIGPALRLVIGKPRDEDINNLNAWLNQILKETSMDFFIDTSSIPILQDPATLQAFNNRIATELQGRFGLPAADADVKTVPRAAAILGMVVLDGEVDPASSGLPDAMRRAWLESLADMPALDAAGKPTTIQVSAVYLPIATLIKTITGNDSQASQQLAFVAREVIAGAQSIPFGHPNFASAVRIALDHYVQTRATGDSLNLPPGSLPGGTQNAGGDSDLVSDNIRVMGLAYSLALLEKTLLLPVTDRLTTLFMNGMLPFGHDAAGKALDDYYWDTEDRFTESQRRSHYSRMLGMPGGEVSKEIAPNKDFEQLFLRLISSVSEFIRQREVDRMFNNPARLLSVTSEQVRTRAFEVGQNASLHSWGAGFHVTTRINRQLQLAIDILNQPQVLKTYAASNHWQVVERVAQQDFGGAPNWSKYSTMAQSSSTIFNLLAKYTSVLSATNSARPFLSETPDNEGDIGFNDTNALLGAVQAWLAVNGVRDDQVKQYAQPSELTSSPSLPSLAAPTTG